VPSEDQRELAGDRHRAGGAVGLGRAAVAVPVDLEAERDLGLVEVVEGDVRPGEAAQFGDAGACHLLDPLDLRSARDPCTDRTFDCFARWGGNHRGVKFEDALVYCERRDAEQRSALSELKPLSEEPPGGYR